MSLEKKLVTGVKWTTSATLVKAVLQLCLLAIAARFLSAEEFGLYAIVQITLGFCQLFMDMGIGNAIIHRQDSKDKHLSELFFINLFISLLLGLLVFVCSGWIAHFFAAPEVDELITFIAPSFVLAALFRIHLVVLQKELAFNLIAKIEIFAQVLGFMVATCLLFSDYLVVSLIIGYLVNLLTQGMGYWLFSPFKLRLAFPTSIKELKAYLSFGLYQTGDATVNYFNSQFDLILVGKLLGSEILGGYSLARQFCFRPAMVINPVLTRVAFPVMAKLQNSEKLPSIYCKLSALLATINFPVYIALAIFAEPLVLVLFGEKWLHIVPLFQLMAIWCLIRSTMNPVGSLMMAIGKVKQLFSWNLSLLVFIPSIIYLGSFYGVEGIATALILMQSLLLLAHWYILLHKHGHISGRAFLLSLYLPLCFALLSGTITYLASDFFTVAYEKLAVAMVVFSITYLLFSIKFNPLAKNLVKGRLTFSGIIN